MLHPIKDFPSLHVGEFRSACLKLQHAHEELRLQNNNLLISWVESVRLSDATLISHPNFAIFPFWHQHAGVVRELIRSRFRRLITISK